MADTKVSALSAVLTATADDLIYLVDGATTSNKITFANFEGAIDHDNLTNTHNLTTDINHDALTNFVANEHIDWTTDQGATNIHSGNYTDTNTTYTAGTGLTLTGTSFSCDITQYADADAVSAVATADDYIKNDADDTSTHKITAANFAVTGDNSTNDTAYVAMVLHGTDATPPAANTVPIGTIYIQYTA